MGSQTEEDKHHEITSTTWREGQDRPKRGSCSEDCRAETLQWVHLVTDEEGGIGRAVSSAKEDVGRCRRRAKRWLQTRSYASDCCVYAVYRSDLVRLLWTWSAEVKPSKR